MGNQWSFFNAGVIWARRSRLSMRWAAPFRTRCKDAVVDARRLTRASYSNQCAAEQTTLLAASWQTGYQSENVEGRWNATKGVWHKAAELACGWTKGTLRHTETWWWNEEVAKAIERKRRCYKIWHKTKTARRNARRFVALAQEKTQ